jgi:hypothetical protein
MVAQAGNNTSEKLKAAGWTVLGGATSELMLPCRKQHAPI